MFIDHQTQTQRLLFTLRQVEQYFVVSRDNWPTYLLVQAHTCLFSDYHESHFLEYQFLLNAIILISNHTAINQTSYEFHQKGYLNFGRLCLKQTLDCTRSVLSKDTKKEIEKHPDGVDFGSDDETLLLRKFYVNIFKEGLETYILECNNHLD